MATVSTPSAQPRLRRVDVQGSGHAQRSQLLIVLSSVALLSAVSTMSCDGDAAPPDECQESSVDFAACSEALNAQCGEQTTGRFIVSVATMLTQYPARRSGRALRVSKSRCATLLLDSELAPGVADRRRVRPPGLGFNESARRRQLRPWSNEGRQQLGRRGHRPPVPMPTTPPQPAPRRSPRCWRPRRRPAHPSSPPGRSAS